MATPIGNLGDITQRALDVLRRVALVAAEDTRQTGNLLRHYGIESKLFALHEHNERSATPRILRTLALGESVALVTDAGTPAISDPGAWLVAQAQRAGFAVSPIPGPCAAAAAMSVSGQTPGRFLFYGFLPARSSQRRAELDRVATLPFALVFYEAPHRAQETIADLVAGFGPTREIVIARELTKIHEQIYAGTLADAVKWIAADPNRTRGEFVLVVAAADVPQDAARDALAERLLAALLAELPLSRAVSVAAQVSGAKRSALYKRALAVTGAALPKDEPPLEPEYGAEFDPAPAARAAARAGKAGAGREDDGGDGDEGEIDDGAIDDAQIDDAQIDDAEIDNGGPDDDAFADDELEEDAAAELDAATEADIDPEAEPGWPPKRH